MIGDLQTVLTALTTGKLDGMSRFVSGLRPCRGSRLLESLMDKRASEKVMQDIDQVLRTRGGKAEVLKSEEEEGFKMVKQGGGGK